MLNRLLNKFKDKGLTTTKHILRRRNGDVFTITVVRGDTLNSDKKRPKNWEAFSEDRFRGYKMDKKGD